MQISPTEKLLTHFLKSSTVLLKTLVTLAVDINTFDFKFFKGSINEELYKIITLEFEDSLDGVRQIKNLYKQDLSKFTDSDKLAIYLYLRFYKSIDNPEYEAELFKELVNSKNSTLLKLYTGKNKLSAQDKDFLLGRKITLSKLLKEGL